jgi:hypothetical protein
MHPPQSIFLDFEALSNQHTGALQALEKMQRHSCKRIAPESPFAGGLMSDMGIYRQKRRRMCGLVDNA